MRSNPLSRPGNVDVDRADLSEHRLRLRANAAVALVAVHSRSAQEVGTISYKEWPGSTSQSPPTAPDLTVATGVTIRQLLDHSSGIPDVAEDLLPLLLADPDRTWSPHEVLAHAAGAPRDFAPGTDHNSSNTNDIIAGLLLEEATGASVDDNLQTRILGPSSCTTPTSPPSVDDSRSPGSRPSSPRQPHRRSLHRHRDCRWSSRRAASPPRRTSQRS